MRGYFKQLKLISVLTMIRKVYKYVEFSANHTSSATASVSFPSICTPFTWSIGNCLLHRAQHREVLQIALKHNNKNKAKNNGVSVVFLILLLIQTEVKLSCLGRWKGNQYGVPLLQRLQDRGRGLDSSLLLSWWAAAAEAFLRRGSVWDCWGEMHAGGRILPMLREWFRVTLEPIPSARKLGWSPMIRGCNV